MTSPAPHHFSGNAPPRIELLAPAGNVEKLEAAVHYGADAVYLGGTDFSLRSQSGNFSIPEIRQAVAFAHKKGVKVYVACNVYPRNTELESLSRFLDRLGEIGPDAVICADPGVISEARNRAPHLPLHLSTQANTTNRWTARFWETIGIRRINAARELSLEEISSLADSCHMEIEAFVHGAMCISYSGRCLLSSFLAGRDGNRGMCAHPCRWRYAVVEEKRPGHYMPLSEDNRGSYIFNSRDLCMIEYVPEMIRAGITSLKIEGRSKGINYVATTVKTYREAIDAYLADPAGWRVKDRWLNDLDSINNRGYGTGFYFNRETDTAPNDAPPRRVNSNRFIGKIIKKKTDGRCVVMIKNRVFSGERVQVMQPSQRTAEDCVLSMTDSRGYLASVAQPNETVTMKLNGDYAPGDLIRKANT